MSRGTQELKRCFAALMNEVQSLRRDQDVTAPLTADVMLVRWCITGPSYEERLHNLASRCREWGLRPMKGTRGRHAMYARAEVLAAEAYAAGKSPRRRRAA